MANNILYDLDYGELIKEHLQGLNDWFKTERQSFPKIDYKSFEKLPGVKKIIIREDLKLKMEKKKTEMYYCDSCKEFKDYMDMHSRDNGICKLCWSRLENKRNKNRGGNRKGERKKK